MSIEEKAKAYDEALKWMRELYPELHGATKEDAEHYFPELRESEDERIGKEIINYLDFAESHDLLRAADYEKKKGWLDWLERKKIPSVSFNPALGFDPGSAVVYHNDESEDETMFNRVIESLVCFRGKVMSEGDESLAKLVDKEIQWMLKCKESLHICESCKENASSFTDEDERIRKALVDYFSQEELYDFSREQVLAWLEKQKENPKSTDSISPDCTSDAKCEDRWHKVEDSLPDNAREVLCKDAIGNYFIGRYYSKGIWEISMYDDCDKFNEDNPPVVMWIDIPSEKQKEIPMPDSTTLLKMWDDEEKMLREKGICDMWRLAYNAFLDGFAKGTCVKFEKQKSISQEDFDTAKHEALGEQNRDFTIYHPLKNGNGKYECIPYSFYGSLSAFSEDKALIDFLRTCFYTKEECEEWIKQKEQKPRKLKLGDKVYWHDDDTNVITITGFRDDAYLTDSAYGPILFCDEDNWKRIEQKPAELRFPYGKNETVDKLIAIAECLEMDGDVLFNGYKGTECGKLLRDLARKQVECKSAEWNEDDERIRQGLIEMYKNEHLVSVPIGVHAKDIIRFLENLRPHWKPSEEQMRALRNVAYENGNSSLSPYSISNKVLASLYEQLKQLM